MKRAVGTFSLALLSLMGCVDSGASSDLLDPVTLVLGETVESEPPASDGDDSAPSGVAAPAEPTADEADNSDGGDATPEPVTDSEPAAPEEQFVSGRLAAGGAYELFPLGPAVAGETWTLDATWSSSATFVVVLFDHQQNLLMRVYMGRGSRLRHTLRADTEDLTIGVMAPRLSSGGDFSLRVRRESGGTVPAPQAHVAWLNFGGASNVSVSGEPALSFGAFDGAMVGSDYAGQTDVLKEEIVAAVRADFAEFNISILTSDDGPPPSEPHATIHFGGFSTGLLGLADSVDAYNQVADEDALVYVESFAAYWTMELTAEEMAVMIANVASHELGHLLGLYHTKNPIDVMDTTGDAWQLASPQSFARAALEDSVFATGMGDSPTILAQTVGYSPFLSAARAKSPVGLAARQIVQGELPHACGTCRRLDHE